MDRLSALAVGVVGVVGLGACDERSAAPGAPPSRVNAAAVAPAQGATVEAFCDVYREPAAAPALQWPALADGAPPPAPASGWRWINVWATWCKPCVEEMPRLLRWRDTLARTAHPVELVFVSVDETAAEVDAYRARQPALPPSLRLADPDQRAAWFGALGLDADPPIPIHAFVDPGGKVRCARAGSVREQDFAVIERLLGK